MRGAGLGAAIGRQAGRNGMFHVKRPARRRSALVNLVVGLGFPCLGKCRSAVFLALASDRFGAPRGGAAIDEIAR